MGGAWRTAKCAGKTCDFSVAFSAPPHRLSSAGGRAKRRRGRRGERGGGKVKISPLGAPNHDEESIQKIDLISGTHCTDIFLTTL